MGEASKAVNFGFLEQYTGGDRALTREVLQVFLEEAKQWAQRLDGADANWEPTIHTMKGTARSIGAAGLGDLCEYAESAGPSALPGVRAALAEVIGEVRGWLAANA
jgi:HPt (histidine-containing phosphotransfer) domain-containing protein